MRHCIRSKRSLPVITFLAASVLYGDQVVVPQTLNIPGVPGTANFTIINPFSDCGMMFTVTNTDDSVAKIAPFGMVTPAIGANQPFTVTAVKPGVTKAGIVTTSNPPRCAFGNDVITITV